jgi:hypothetical protein
MAYAVKGLTEAGRHDEAQKIIRVFKKPGNRSSLYAFAATELLNEKKDAKTIQALIDSSRNEINRAQNVTGFQPNRFVLSYALALQDPETNMPEINRLIKNLPGKLFPIQSVCRAYAFNNHLYQARSFVPNLISNDDLANSFWYILYGYSYNDKAAASGWKGYRDNNIQIFTRRINYLDESN